MHKLVSVLLVLNLVLSLFGCGGANNEENGVPLKQLVEEIFPTSRTENTTVKKCTHNVDTILHRDIVELQCCIDYKYMRTDYVQSYVYQYNKATDIWTQISRETRSSNHTILNNLENTRWSGTTDAGWGNNINYIVTVDAINTMDGWIEFSYNISYVGRYYSGTAYLDYGRFSLSQVENLFTITFDPDEGFTVWR